MTTKIDAALLVTPFDVAATLIAFGAEQAMTWTGVRPKDDNEFYYELGRRVSQMSMKAWDEQLQNRSEDRWD